MKNEMNLYALLNMIKNILDEEDFPEVCGVIDTYVPAFITDHFFLLSQRTCRSARQAPLEICLRVGSSLAGCRLPAKPIAGSIPIIEIKNIYDIL